MMTIDLASLFADPDCPDCVLLDALTDSDVDVPAALRGYYVRHIRQLFPCIDEPDERRRAARAVELADAIHWASCEWVDCEWDDCPDDNGAMRCTVRHPDEPSWPESASLVGHDDDSAFQQLTFAELCESLRAFIPEPHPLTDAKPEDVAREHGLTYYGDVNPVDYGGMWHTVDDWGQWGYAECVEIEPIDDGQYLVSLITVNKPSDNATIADVAGCMGLGNKWDTAGTPAQIEACKEYGLVEYDQQYTFSVIGRTTRNVMLAFLADLLNQVRTRK